MTKEEELLEKLKAHDSNLYGLELSKDECVLCAAALEQQLANDPEEMRINKKCMKVLKHLLENNLRQVIEVYGKEECVDDLTDILVDMGISSDILERYRL